MDQISLVDTRIEDGQRLIQQLVRENFDVTVAFWLRTGEEDWWHLYVASKVVDERGLAEAYRALQASLQQLPGTTISFADVKLIGPANALAEQMLNQAVRRTSGGFEEAYIYSPVSGWAGSDERWRGIEIIVFPEPTPQDTYFVEFWPHELQAMLGSGGQARRVPRPAGVRVEGGKITWYRPPEKPLPHLKQDDYEQKALEAVKQQAGKGG